MNRRRYLSALGTLAGTAVAGCTGDGTGGDGTDSPTSSPTPTATASATPSPTPTDTPTPTESPTPSPKPPVIDQVNPVTRWQGFGDVIDNSIESVGQGGYVRIGGRYRIWTHGGTVGQTVGAQIYNADGNRVGQQQRSDESLTDKDGHAWYEWTLQFQSTTWSKGEYSGTYIVRDDRLDRTSERVSYDLQIVDPLEGNEAEIVSYDGPDTVEINESFNYTLTLRNNANRDSSIVSDMSVSQDGGAYRPAGQTFRVNIPAGQTVEWPITGASLSQYGELSFRINDIEDEWSITVE